jgi:hypothetical protein
MDISKVRLKFQRSWDFIIHTDASIDLSQALYSLEQGSLNSDNMLLYVTNLTLPPLEGHVIESHSQKWIVFKMFKEVVNEKLYEFRLYPVLGSLILRQVNSETNDLGLVPVSGPTTSYTLDCYIEEFSQKERTVPTKQPVESYEQTFLVAAKQMPTSLEAADLIYEGHKYKIGSFEHLNGIVKIRATKDL